MLRLHQPKPLLPPRHSNSASTMSPNAFYLALRMGTSRSESTRRWVWQVNPFRPIRENATFALHPDGNLVLADSDGRIVWTTGTAQKGVIGLEILSNGNVVLYDNRNRFVWQSFNHPTETLLVRQSLRLNGPNKLVCKNGAHSFVMKAGELAMYINNITSKPLKYAIVSSWGKQKQTSVQFQCELEYGNDYAYELRFNEILSRPKYNATLSFLRIEEDGNLVVNTYYDRVDWQAWERTFAFFSYEIGQVDGCELPSKCGGLGVCKDGMRVACPAKQGLLGWSDNCATPELDKCNNDKNVDYYKVEGVENFLTSYGKREGNVNVEEGKRRCSLDCKCVGFFYWEMESKCWVAPMIGILNSVSYSSHAVSSILIRLFCV